MFESKLKSSSLASLPASQGWGDCKNTRLRNRKMRSERGYVLLVLLLLVAFLSIASLKMVEDFNPESKIWRVRTVCAFCANVIKIR